MSDQERQQQIEALIETVKRGAHFYMAHHMTESPHEADPEITVATHVPGDENCPGCAAEAALDALAARLSGLQDTLAAKDEALNVLAHYDRGKPETQAHDMRRMAATALALNTDGEGAT